MFKKVIFNLLILTLFFINTSISFSDSSQFYHSNINQATITIDYDVKVNVKTKLKLEKDGINYYYNLVKKNQTFPLQLGNGIYTICIFEQKEGNKYSLINKDSFTLELTDENDAYLTSNEIINWSVDSDAVILAKELTNNIVNDDEKLQAIYSYIIKNIKYDSEKAKTLSNNYLPNADYTLKSKKAICYDYASLFAVMARSIGIPTKLLKGQKNDIDAYHAWNESYVNNEWLTIDCTYNAELDSKGYNPDIIMKSDDYIIEKVY